MGLCIVVGFIYIKLIMCECVRKVGSCWGILYYTILMVEGRENHK